MLQGLATTHLLDPVDIHVPPPLSRRYASKGLKVGLKDPMMRIRSG
jgi:hypothetical protein